MPQPRILIAEDDQYLAALIRQTLEEQGMAVTWARNGQDALNQSVECWPDLIILDVSMPILDGFQVLRALKTDRLHGDTPVLMLTACRSENDVLRAISEGAADYLSKPFQTHQLAKRVDKLLDSHAGRMSLSAIRGPAG